MRWPFFAVLAGAGLVCAEARPATLRVPSEYPTIQAGLDASVAGDTVLVAPGMCTESETRLEGGAFGWTACAFMVDGVTLRSEAGSGSTVIDMQQAPGPQPAVILARHHASGETLIEGFTITGARAGGRGAYVLSDWVTFRDCVFRDLDAGESGGGGIAANGNLRLERCEFVNCLGTIGGAIYHSNGRIEMFDTVVRACGQIGAHLAGGLGEPLESSLIERCTFEDCWGTSTGGLGIDGHHGGSVVRNCRFIRNVGGSASPGGMTTSGFTAAPKIVEGCLFWGNSAAGANGSGGALGAFGPVAVRGNTFVGNSSASYGAAVALNSNTSGSLSNNVFLGNLASHGAVERVLGSTVSSSCNVFWQNIPGYPVSSTDRLIDPLLCDPATGEFGLRPGSPCLPEGSLGCGLIGAFGEDCGTVSVVPSTWGEVKAAYRGEERGTR